MKGWIFIRHVPEDEKFYSYSLKHLLSEAKKRDIALELLNPDQIDCLVGNSGYEFFHQGRKISDLPQFVLPRLGAKATAYSLSVIRHLERMGIPVVNSSVAIERVKDKFHTLQILAQKNLPLPKTLLLRFPVNLEFIQSQFQFPVIVKPLSGWKGIGVHLVDTPVQFEGVMELLQSVHPEPEVIVQEFIQPSRGKDLRVLVIGGKAKAAMQRESHTEDFRANYSKGAQVQSHPLSQEMTELAVQAAKTADLEIAGVDLLFDTQGFRICEVNSSPGFEGLESCHSSLNVASEIFEFVLKKV